MDSKLQNKIISKVEEMLSISIVGTSIPPQGMGSDVFFISTDCGKEYVIKVGGEDITDVYALDLIRKKSLDISVPRLFGYFRLGDKIIIILEKMSGLLLESVSKNDLPNYIESMLRNLRKIHKVKSSMPGFLNGLDGDKTWKELLLYKYSGNHPWFDWDEIVKREGVDEEIIFRAIEQLTQRIEDTEFPEKDFSLLHTDFNQRNLFVNQETKEITGIIDWGEAMFGDPLYDFARIRMFILHFDLPASSLQQYYDFLQMTEGEKNREEIYLISQMIDYIAWYSEELNEFNSSRLKLHQGVLRKWLGV